MVERMGRKDLEAVVVDESIFLQELELLSAGQGGATGWAVLLFAQVSDVRLRVQLEHGIVGSTPPRSARSSPC